MTRDEMREAARRIHERLTTALDAPEGHRREPQPEGHRREPQLHTPHTPGPWKVDPSEMRGCKFVHETTTGAQYEVAQVYGRTDSEKQANAALIAAAPTLLEALADLRGKYTFHPNDEAMIDAAILAARGGAR